MAFSTPADLRDFYPESAGDSNTKLATILDAAWWEIERLAPPPDPVTLDYQDRAITAELRIARFFLTEHLSSESRGLDVLRTQRGYKADANVERIIKGVMGPYFVEDDAVAYAEPLPRT